MQPENLRFGGGMEHTVANPLVVVAVILAGILICFLPRKYAIVPFLVVAILIPMDQVIVAGPFHFYMLRILILFGLVRLLWGKVSSKHTMFSGGINGIDIALILGTIVSTVNVVLLWETSDAFIHQLGMIYTVFGIYFLLRSFVRNEEDVERAIRVFAYIVVVVAAVMAYEQVAGWNPYALLGGSREATYRYLVERGDRFRAMGPFAHPILAGTCGAFLMPLFVGLWWKTRKHRFVLLAGIVASTVMTIASVSSTPALAYAAGVGALCLWPLRNRMRLLRWSVVLSLIGLQMVMKAPVWALIARVRIIGGSSGYHRYMLVDHFIHRFGDWWLLGTKTNAEWGWDMWDTANQYVHVGEGSGLIPLLCFLAILVYGFKYLGMARSASQGRRTTELFLWALSAALFANTVAFFGISYFDQTQVAWYALLAMISAATVSFRKRSVESPLRPAYISMNPTTDCSTALTTRSIDDDVLSTRMRQFRPPVP